MFNAVHWFTGFMLISTQPVIKVVSQETDEQPEPCEVVSEKLFANCYDKSWTKVPDDLEPNLEILNISRNPINNLTEQDFKRYSKLKELIMIDLHPLYTSINALAALTSLQTLDISYSYIGNPPFTLPTSIRQLTADGLGTTVADVHQVDLSKLTHLEKLSMQEAHLQDMPILFETAPLVSLDLRLNPLANFSYSDIAPYCLLRNLALEGNEILFQDTEACCGLRTWVDRYNITSNLKCIANGSNSDESPCKDEQELNEDAISMYEQCLGAATMLYIQIIVAAIMIFGIAFLIYKFYRSRAVRHHKNLKQHQDDNRAEEEETEPEEKNAQITSPNGETIT